MVGSYESEGYTQLAACMVGLQLKEATPEVCVLGRPSMHAGQNTPANLGAYLQHNVELLHRRSHISQVRVRCARFDLHAGRCESASVRHFQYWKVMHVQPAALHRAPAPQEQSNGQVQEHRQVSQPTFPCPPPDPPAAAHHAPAEQPTDAMQPLTSGPPTFKSTGSCSSGAGLVREIKHRDQQAAGRPAIIPQPVIFAHLQIHRQLLVRRQQLTLCTLADGQGRRPLPRLTIQLGQDVDVGQVGLQPWYSMCGVANTS